MSGGGRGRAVNFASCSLNRFADIIRKCIVSPHACGLKYFLTSKIASALIWGQS